MLTMAYASFAQVIIMTQLVFIGLLEYRLQREACHVTCADPHNWIRPILRFPDMTQVSILYLCLQKWSINLLELT